MSKGGRRDIRPVVLIVLDGWGYRPAREGNAIELGRTPVWHRLWDTLPHTLLDASGHVVGTATHLVDNVKAGTTVSYSIQGTASQPAWTSVEVAVVKISENLNGAGSD